MIEHRNYVFGKKPKKNQNLKNLIKK